MARGWESKSVESQQELAREPRSPKVPKPSQQKLLLTTRRDNLLHERTRILSELQAACNPRFRGHLEGALAHLEAELRSVEEQISHTQ